MKRFSAVPAAVLASLFVFLLVDGPSVSSAESDLHPTRIVLGTATPGGGFQLFGQHLAEVINEREPSLRVEAIATRGSLQNLKLLWTGKIDIGLVEGNAAHQALEGVGRAPANLAVLSVTYPNPGMFAVLADSPYRNIEDLKGKPVAFGTRASGLRILASDVPDGIGLAPERDFEPVILDKAGDGPRMVLDGKVEALRGAGIGWPGFLKIAVSPAGGRFIAPSAAQVEQILNKHPHLRTMSVSAGTYKGQSSPIASVGLWSLILVRPALSEEIVYRLAFAIHSGEIALAERLELITAERARKVGTTSRPLGQATLAGCDWMRGGGWSGSVSSSWESNSFWSASGWV